MSALGRTQNDSNDVFFVGYLRTPPALGRFFWVLVPLVLLAVLALGATFVAAQRDVGDGRFVFMYEELAGRLETRPYPVVYLPPSDLHPDGHAIVLSGSGKRGVIAEAAGLDGQPVDVGGVFITRGSGEMLQVGGALGLQAAAEPRPEAAVFTPEPESLGRATLAGEIVDSKCYLGAMRPGEGKVHMACAGLCIMGGIPPMFVTWPAEGEPVLYLLAGPDGGPVDQTVLLETSLYVRLTGEVERRADLLVFKVDPASLEVL